MANVLLVVQLIIALALIGVVLMQRSEGGGLGMGGGGGGGGMMSGRSAATALSKVTWALGVAFFVVCLALTMIAASDAGGGSVLEGVGADIEVDRPGLAPDLQGDLLPPGLDGDDDLALPPAAD